MDARRLLLIVMTGAVAALLTQGLTGYHSDEEVATALVQPSEFAREDLNAKPGEIVWSNWKDAPKPTLAPNEPVVRDVLAGEMRFENLPDEVRERIERDFKGLDVVLPKRTIVREAKER